MCCLFVSSRVQTAKKEFKEQWQENVKKGGLIPSFDENLKRDLTGYIEYCTGFSWRIMSQVPPLNIDYNSSTFNPSYLTESQAFASTAVRSSQGRCAYPQERKGIRCYVWPTLYDWDNRVIKKGDVVLEEPITHVTVI